MDIVRAFRIVSIAEATSFLVLLLIAMPLKYAADFPVAVQIVGPIHGVLFLGYLGALYFVHTELRWTGTRTALAAVAAVLPVAPFLVERYWTSSAQGISGTPGTTGGGA